MDNSNRLNLIIEMFNTMAPNIGCVCCSMVGDLERVEKAIITVLDVLLTKEEKSRYMARFTSCFVDTKSSLIGMAYITTLVGSECIGKAEYIEELKKILA